MANMQKMAEKMTSRERAYLRGLASTYEAIFHIGKSGVTPELTEGVNDALNARELIKISVLKNCPDDPRALAEVLADRTHSDIIQVIGRKIVLYKKSADKPKIIVK